MSAIDEAAHLTARVRAYSELAQVYGEIAARHFEVASLAFEVQRLRFEAMLAAAGLLDAPQQQPTKETAPCSQHRCEYCS